MRKLTRRNVFELNWVREGLTAFLAVFLLSLFCVTFPACSKTTEPEKQSSFSQNVLLGERMVSLVDAASEAADLFSPEARAQRASADAFEKLNLTKDIRASFDHGEKGAEFQKYIVLHDTEGEGSALGVVDWWDSNGQGVAAHFVINKDGSIVQCVELDRITHHAGYGDTGHNDKYGTTDESRDDKVGTTPIGSWASDYGMNSYSVGIEMVHTGGSGDYPEAQLEALDDLIAYIDAYYGFESKIIDHKAWRSGNSDTSKEFAHYLANYQDHRTHD